MANKKSTVGDARWRKKVKISPDWKDHEGRWAAPQHYTCSYMAMFPPQLPHYFISKFTEPGDIVLDPFSGRGTTAVQAISQGRIGIGNDLNELAYILTKGKLANPSLDEVLERIQQLDDGFDKEKWKRPKGAPKKIRMIFHINTLKHLLYLKKELKWRDDPVDSFLTMVLMGAMHGSSPGFLSLPMPNTFSMGWNYVEKYIATHNLEKPDRNAFKILRDRCKRFLRIGPLPGEGFAIHGDVRNLSTNEEIEKGSVKLIFSSPPYLKVIKYGLYNWIRLWWLIGSHEKVDRDLDDGHSIEPYLDFMQDTMEEMIPLLNPKDSLVCWVIGDVNEINLAEIVADRATSVSGIDCNGKANSYRILGIFDDHIADEKKVTKLWNSAEDKSGKATTVDRILIMCLETTDPMNMKINRKINWESILPCET